LSISAIWELELALTFEKGKLAEGREIGFDLGILKLSSFFHHLKCEIDNFMVADLLIVGE
jgi:hypothetical protein